MNSLAVALLSGGMDSAVSAAWAAREQGFELVTLAVREAGVYCEIWPFDHCESALVEQPRILAVELLEGVVGEHGRTRLVGDAQHEREEPHLGVVREEEGCEVGQLVGAVLVAVVPERGDGWHRRQGRAARGDLGAPGLQLDGARPRSGPVSR